MVYISELILVRWTLRAFILKSVVLEGAIMKVNQPWSHGWRHGEVIIDVLVCRALCDIIMTSRGEPYIPT